MELVPLAAEQERLHLDVEALVADLSGTEAQAAEIERAIAEILAKAKRVGVVAATRALGKALASLGDVTPPS